MKYLKFTFYGVFLLFLWATYAVGAELQEFTAPIDKDGIQRVEVLGGSYYFLPRHIIVKVNVPVELKIRKEGITPHNFVIAAPDAGMDINQDLKSEPSVIKFTPSREGSFPFYCDKKFLFMQSHRARGMEGTLEVRP